MFRDSGLRSPIILVAGLLGATLRPELGVAYPENPTAEPTNPRSRTTLSDDSSSSQLRNSGDPAASANARHFGAAVLHPGGTLQEVSLSPDGSLVAAVGYSGPITIWDTATGQLLHRIEGHAEGDSARSVAFSPDGHYLATGGSDWTVRVWDVATGRQVQLLRAHRYGLLGLVWDICVAFNANGRQLISGAHDGVIQIWDVRTGSKLSEIPGPGKVVNAPVDPSSSHAITSLTVSADARVAAVSDLKGTIRMVDLRTGQELAEIRTEFQRVYDLALSPDGKRLSWCGMPPKNDSNGLVLWDCDRKEVVQRFAEERRATISSVAFSPDGASLVSTGGGKIKLREVASGRELWSAAITEPREVTWSRNGSIIATCGGDGRIRLWDPATGLEHPVSQAPGLDAVAEVQITPEGSILSAHKDGTVVVRDAAGTVQRTVSIGARNSGDFHRNVALSPSSTLIAVGQGSKVTLWNLVEGVERWSSEELGALAEIQFQSPTTDFVTFSPDGRYVLAMTTDGSDSRRNNAVIRIWSTERGTSIAEVELPKRFSVSPVFMPHAEAFALSSFARVDDNSLEGYQINFIRTLTSEPLTELRLDKVFGTLVAVTPDSKHLVVVDRGAIGFRNAATGELEFSLHHPLWQGYFRSIQVSPDGSRVAASSPDRDVTYVWNVADGKITHAIPVGSSRIAFSPAGDRLLLGFPDGTLTLYDLPSDAAPPRIFQHLSEKELERRWFELAFIYNTSLGNEGSFERAQAFVEGGDGTVKFLERELLREGATEYDGDQARQLVAGLADPDLHVRLEAAALLERFGDNMWSMLSRLDVAMQPVPPSAQDELVNVILQGMKYRRESEAFNVLKQIATPEAERVLQRISESGVSAFMAKHCLDQLRSAKYRWPY